MESSSTVKSSGTLYTRTEIFNHIGIVADLFSTMIGVKADGVQVASPMVINQKKEQWGPSNMEDYLLRHHCNL